MINMVNFEVAAKYDLEGEFTSNYKHYGKQSEQEE